MKKNLRKNKKGFTLVEIIVVLLIIGILLAITIPSIMGYVGKARDAQIQADARTGFLGAQTISARLKAEGTKESASNGISSKIDATSINTEAGITIVKYAKCTVSPTTDNLEKCLIRVTDEKEKYVFFKAGADGKAGDSEVIKASDIASSDAKDLAEKDKP